MSIDIFTSKSKLISELSCTWDISDFFIRINSSFWIKRLNYFIENKGSADELLKELDSIGKYKLIPSESLQVGSTSALDGKTGAPNNPIREGTVPAFFMQDAPVSLAEWMTVLVWAEANGYDFTNRGEGVSDEKPVTKVNWYDAVKWCNAKSEMEQLDQCYKLDGLVYRKGEVYHSGVICDFYTSGYRLPTQADWNAAQDLYAMDAIVREWLWDQQMVDYQGHIRTTRGPWRWTKTMGHCIGLRTDCPAPCWPEAPDFKSSGASGTGFRVALSAI